MWLHLFVIAVLAIPFGLYAAFVNTALIHQRSDLGRTATIAVLSIPFWVTREWDLIGTSLLVIAFVSTTAVIRDRLGPQTWKPSIQTLFVAVAWAAAVFLVLHQTGGPLNVFWIDFIGLAWGVSIWTAFGGSKHAGSKRNTNSWLRRSMAILIFAATTLSLARFNTLSRNLRAWEVWPNDTSLDDVWRASFLSPDAWDLRWIPIAILCLITGWSSRAISLVALSSRHSRTQKPLSLLAHGVCLASVVFSLCLWWIVIRPSGLHRASNQNEAIHKQLFEQVQAIAQSVNYGLGLDASNPTDRAKLNSEELLTLVDNAFITATTNEIRVPVKGTMEDLDNLDAYADARQAARILDFALQCQTSDSDELTLLHQRSSRTIESFFSHGLMIDELVRIACMELIHHGIWGSRSDLSETQLLDVIDSLQVSLESREPVEDIEVRDQAWSRSSLGWFLKIRELINYLEPNSPTYDNFRIARDLETAKVRLMIIDLLLRIHKQRSGSLPGSLNDLNTLLKELNLTNEILRDPFQVNENGIAIGKGYFKYDAQEQKHKLYSIGKNQIDDQGKNNEHSGTLGPATDDIELTEHYSRW
ncbi:MAG: hypothetical protein AAF664_20990 [Planctomycetota bacterium]